MALTRKFKRLGKRILRSLVPTAGTIALPAWRPTDDLPHGPGIALAIQGQDVWFSSRDADLRPMPEAAICLLAPWCAREGLALRLDHPTPSPAFLATARSATALMGRWWGHRAVVFKTPGNSALPPPAEPAVMPGDTALFFSGGVDSFYSLVMNPTIRVLVYIIGADIPLTNRAVWEARMNSHRRIAEERGLHFIAIFTNVRVHPALKTMSWGRYHGSVLAAIAHSLHLLASRWIISASWFPGVDMPWGSHPELDWRWGNDAVSFNHFGIDKWRGEKLAAMSDGGLHQHLHVCYRDPSPEGNCGRCEKCIRTRLTYLCEVPGTSCGRMPETPPLPEGVDAIDRLRFDYLTLTYERFLRFLPPGSPITAAIGRLLLRSRRRSWWSRMTASLFDRTSTTPVSPQNGITT